MPDGTSETAAIPDLLDTLDLAGAIVPLDAAGGQRATAGAIRQRAGYYLPAVKGDQPTLHAAVGGERAWEAELVGGKGPQSEPPVADVLAVDAAYRERAVAGSLRRIAPRRFNRRPRRDCRCSRPARTGGVQ